MFAACSHREMLIVGFLKNGKLGKNGEILLSVVQRVKSCAHPKPGEEVLPGFDKENGGIVPAHTCRCLPRLSQTPNPAKGFPNWILLLSPLSQVGCKPSTAPFSPLKIWFCGFLPVLHLNSRSKSPPSRPCLIFTA